MTNIISDDALAAQQSRIMNAMRASANPSSQQVSPQDLLQALTAEAGRSGDYFSMMKQAQTTQAQNNLTAETGIYNRMKEQVTNGNPNATAIDKAISDIAGDDPKIYASIAQDLHNDPETITPANVKSKVMKVAAERGINPLSQQESEAKLSKTKAEAAKAQGEANQLNIFNPTNSITPTMGVPTNPALPGAISGTQPSSDAQTATNEGYLSALPSPVASQVKALAEGRMQFPSGFALKSPYWQQMLQAVSTYDPSFDAVNYNARAQTRKDFTSGKSAQNITALNTAMGHLDSLDKAFTALNNGDYPTYNTVANKLGVLTGNRQLQSATTDVQTKAIAVAGELAKVFRSTGMSSKEIDDWKDQITPATTPAQAKKLVQSAIELMNSRLDAVGQQYNQGMGTTRDPIQLLSPKAQAAYQRLAAPEAKQATMPVSEASPEIQQQVARNQNNNTGKVIDYREYFK